jgi:hypothetical protein
VFQHFVWERREVALLLAGLPQQVSALLRDKQVSFLRRAFQHRLEISAVAARMGVTGNYANQYRARLIERGIIGQRGRGRIGFDMPMLRDYLRQTGRG